MLESHYLARLGYLALVLVAILGWVLVEYRKRLGSALRTMLAWGLIIIGLMAGYGLWNDITRDNWLRQETTAEGELRLTRAMDGHFHATLIIDGTPLEMLVDTGATSLVLTQEDAVRLGIDPETLRYNGSANTANGTVRTARVTLPNVDLGPWSLGDVTAQVNGGPMQGSLLGMSVLSRFRITIDGRTMILAPR